MRGGLSGTGEETFESGRTRDLWFSFRRSVCKRGGREGGTRGELTWEGVPWELVLDEIREEGLEAERFRWRNGDRSCRGLESLGARVVDLGLGVLALVAAAGEERHRLEEDVVGDQPRELRISLPSSTDLFLRQSSFMRAK